MQHRKKSTQVIFWEKEDEKVEHYLNKNDRKKLKEIWEKMTNIEDRQIKSNTWVKEGFKE